MNKVVKYKKEKDQSRRKKNEGKQKHIEEDENKKEI